MLLSVAMVAAVASACGRATQPPVAGEATVADSAEQILFDVHTVMTEKGVKRGDMYADTVYVFNDQTRFALRNVRSTFTTETGEPNGTLKGKRGTYDLRTQVLEGFGDVVVTSTDGKVLASPHLKYVQSTNTVSSDSTFSIRRQKDIQRGIGFDSDPNLKVFNCHRACRGEALVPLKGLDKP